jgi:hypothetical protein
MRIRPLFLPLCAILLLTTGCVIENAPSDSIVIIEGDNIEENSDEADENLGDDINDNCLVSDLPYYGSASFPNNSLSLEYKLESTKSQEFELIISEGEYGFFIYPAALGEATFFGGAWGGAAWEPYDPNSTATRNEPVIIMRDNTQWFVYRTDFPNNGRLLSKVIFANPGLSIGDSSTCHVDGLKQGDESAFVFNLESAAEYTQPIVEALPAPSADNNNEICTVNALPVYGAIDLTQSSRQLLSQSLAGFQGEDFDITLLENQYGFFAYPAALGKANFYDRDFINARGGWHGATWTPYNATSEEFSVMDPIVAEVGGTFWYIYRTDSPSFGDRTHAVRFENSSLMIGDEVACDVSGMSFVDYQQLEIDIQGDTLAPMPPETSGDVEGVCTFTAMPRVGGASKNIGLATEIQALNTSFTSLENLNFTLDLPTSEYGFFAYPAALGEAVFRDENSGFTGGWDGATWDLGIIRYGNVYKSRPLVTNVNDSKWFIYRADFSGYQSLHFSVEFANKDLALGDKVGCDLAEFAQVSTGSVIGDDLTIVRIFVFGDTDIELAEGVVENGEWTINTTYFDLRDVDDADLNRFNAEGLYDMYFYSSDGTDHGPISITVEDGKVTNDSFDISLM